ncbi:hypothetical protein GEMRC1_002588 [Eukaryota sp. GEM-RC1]
MSDTDNNLLNDLDIFLSGSQPPQDSEHPDIEINSNVSAPQAPTFIDSTHTSTSGTTQKQQKKDEDTFKIPSHIQQAAVRAVVSEFTGEDILPPAKTTQQAQQSGDKPPFYKLSRYSFLFDVDTKDVLKRMGDAILPIKAKNFVPSLNNNPDFYGPFWIVTTLILLLSMGGNFNSLWNAVFNDEEFHFNVALVGRAVSIMYFYFGLMPSVMWALYAWIAPVCPRLRELYCIYGYSSTIYLATFFIDLMPLALFWWLSGVIGGTVAGLFTMQALLGVVETVPTVEGKIPNNSKSVMLSMVAGGVQVGFALLLKLVLRG